MVEAARVCVTVQVSPLRSTSPPSRLTSSVTVEVAVPALFDASYPTELLEAPSIVRIPGIDKDAGAVVAEADSGDGFTATFSLPTVVEPLVWLDAPLPESAVKRGREFGRLEQRRPADLVLGQQNAEAPQIESLRARRGVASLILRLGGPRGHGEADAADGWGDAQKRRGGNGFSGSRRLGSCTSRKTSQRDNDEPHDGEEDGPRSDQSASTYTLIRVTHANLRRGGGS